MNDAAPIRRRSTVRTAGPSDQRINDAKTQSQLQL